MISIPSPLDCFAFEIGTQVIARLRVEAGLDKVRDQFAELQVSAASGTPSEAPPFASSVEAGETVSASKSVIEHPVEAFLAGDCNADQIPKPLRTVDIDVYALADTPRSIVTPPSKNLQAPVVDVTAPSLIFLPFTIRNAASELRASPLGSTILSISENEPVQSAR